MTSIRRDISDLVAGNRGSDLFSFEMPAWYDDALCAQVDPGAFFPPKGASLRPAKRVCAACPVRDECLAFAMDNNELHGVWGGLSELDRRKMRKAAAA